MAFPHVLLRIPALLAVLVVALAVGTSPASAASVYKQNQAWVFDDTSGGVNNTVTVTLDAGTGELLITSVEPYVFPDATCTVSAGTPNSIRCPRGLSTTLAVNLGDGDDVGTSLISSPVGAPIVTWNGGQGSDRITGGGNHDVFSSPDVDGADTYVGGDGTDTMRYAPDGRAQRLTLISARLDGTATSGAIGENDSIASDVEGVYGTDLGDAVTGNAASNELEGDGWLLTGDGADTLNGEGGNDALRGYKGNDKLNGGAGDDLQYGDDGDDVARGGPGSDVLHGVTGADQLFGDAGADTLNGGDGKDVLTGGPDKDRFSAGGGNDMVNAKDRTKGEKIDCGAGVDTAIIDKGDKPNRNCERVRYK